MVSVFQWPLNNLEVIFFYQDMFFIIDVKQICTLHNVATLETSSLKVMLTN